jgi:hypothetical protein
LVLLDVCPVAPEPPPPIQTTQTEVTPAGAVHEKVPAVVKASWLLIEPAVKNELIAANIMGCTLER